MEGANKSKLPVTFAPFHISRRIQCIYPASLALLSVVLDLLAFKVYTNT